MTNEEVLDFMGRGESVYFYNAKYGDVNPFIVNSIHKTGNVLSININGSSGSFTVYSSDLCKTKKEASLVYCEKQIKERERKIYDLNEEIKDFRLKIKELDNEKVDNDRSSLVDSNGDVFF